MGPNDVRLSVPIGTALKMHILISIRDLYRDTASVALLDEQLHALAAEWNLLHYSMLEDLQKREANTEIKHLGFLFDVRIYYETSFFGNTLKKAV